MFLRQTVSISKQCKFIVQLKLAHYQFIVRVVTECRPPVD